MEAPESDRRRDHQPSTRPRALAFGRTLGLLDIGENAPDTLQIPRADIGQRDLPRGPLQQPGAETILAVRGPIPRGAGLGLRRDMAAAYARMNSYLRAANDELNSGNITAARSHMDKADKEISTLESFLGK